MLNANPPSVNVLMNDDSNSDDDEVASDVPLRYLSKKKKCEQQLEIDASLFNNKELIYGPSNVLKIQSIKKNCFDDLFCCVSFFPSLSLLKR